MIIIICGFSKPDVQRTVPGRGWRSLEIPLMTTSFLIMGQLLGQLDHRSSHPLIFTYRDTQKMRCSPPETRLELEHRVRDVFASINRNTLRRVIPQVVEKMREICGKWRKTCTMISFLVTDKFSFYSCV